MGLGAGLDRCRRSRPHRVRSSDRPARSESLYRLRYPGRLENRNVRRESEHKKGKKLDGGINYTMKSCIVCTLCQILLIRSNCEGHSAFVRETSNEYKITVDKPEG